MIEVDGIIFSLQRHGGVSVYTRQVIAGLEAAERSAVLSLVEPNHVRPQELSFKKVEVRARPARLLERYRPFPSVPEASLAHSTYYRVPVDARVPLVTTVHDFIYERYFTGPALWVHRTQKRRAIQRSVAVICVSHATRSDLLRFVPEVNPATVKVVHNGVGEEFGPCAVAAPERPFVLFVGKREGYKNFRLVLHALDQLRGWSVVCVGGEAPGDPDFVELPEGARSQVTFLRGIGNTELNRLYNQAVCLAYTSEYEGFGIPVLEAMRAGCPVVTAGCPSVLEIAGRACRVVPPDDPGAFARACREVVEPAARKELQEAGIEAAKAFSWSRCHGETAAVYDEVLRYAAR